MLSLNKDTADTPTSKLLFWALFALISAALLFPFASFRYPSMADYPNHLARIHIITGQAHDSWKLYYEASHDIVPNLALDVIVPALMYLGISSEAGLKLFAALAFLGPALGTVLLGMTITRRLPWITLLALPLVFSRYYVWGFLNYFFSLGLALLLLAYWLNIRRQDTDGSTDNAIGSSANSAMQTMHTFFLAGGICALLFCHLVGYVLFLVTAFAYEATGLKASRSNEHKNLRQLIWATLPSITLYLSIFEKNTDGLYIQYYDYFFGKFVGLASIVFTYQFLPALFCLLILGVTFVAIIYLQRSAITVTNTFRIPLGILTLIFIASPAAMMGSAFLDRRLPIFICFVALASIRIKYTRATLLTLIVASLALVSIKLAEILPIWNNANQALSLVRNELLAIEPGKRLVQHPVLPNGGRDDLAALRHASAFAVIDRGVFIPTLFAQPYNGESIAYLNPSQSSLRLDEGQVIASLKEINWSKTCSGYDYVLLTGKWPHTTLPDCVRQIAVGTGYELFAVNREN